MAQNVLTIVGGQYIETANLGVMKAGDTGIGDLSMAALTATSLKVVPVAFASLPTGVTGMRAFVNNNSAAPAFLSAANGSGSTTVPVFYNGSAWLVG